jgi:transposase, IS30 family
MAGRERPGPPPLTMQRAEFGRLVASGVTNSEACRLVGVNRRTGTRWRFGRTVRVNETRTREYPAVIISGCRVVSPRFLSEAERVVIADLRRAGMTVRVIAAELGRAPSTIARELTRNRDGAGRYRPFGAQQLAVARRRRPGRHRLVRDLVLREFVQAKLSKRWSPEQISQALPAEFPAEPRRWLTVETIYQAVYSGVVRRDRQALRSGRIRRRPHRRAEVRRPTGKRKMLEDRPPAAAERSEPGHWEGDLIMGAYNRSAIGTLVDRCTRQVILVRLPSKSAEVVTAALRATIDRLPAILRRTLTWDQGTELAAHEALTAQTGVPVFFCDKARPLAAADQRERQWAAAAVFPQEQ